MQRQLILLFVLLICIYPESGAQTLVLDSLDMPMYEARVKLVDEFFARFNGVEKRKDVSSEFSDRKSNILMLFNLAQFKSKTDSLFLEADTLAQKAVNDSICLHYSDSCWYAKVKCHGTIAKKKVDFSLYLSVERRGDHMYKWVIAHAEGTLFNTSRSRKHQELFLSPNDHEQSFMSLFEMTDEAYRYVDDYAKNGYESDALSVFLTLVRCGQLKINYVSDVEFVFLQIPGYIFTVKHFERENMNVGWLIHSFEKCSEAEKIDKLKLIHL